MKCKYKQILFLIGLSILYTCLIRFLHAVTYTHALKEQFSGNMIFVINLLFCFLLCIPTFIFLFILLKHNGLKRTLSYSGILLKEHGITILLYFFVLYIIERNCFSGYWVFSFLGKEVLFSENQMDLLIFCSYLFDDYFTLFIIGITPFVGYLSIHRTSTLAVC